MSIEVKRVLSVTELGDLDLVLAMVKDELLDAMSSYVPMTSCHEGFAILKEEVDELWDEVRRSPKTRDVGALRAEAIQVAAMGLRFVIDTCGVDR